ncbi:MAG: GNAT family N-acetyltransferase [Rubrivivax sp.]|nr:GNAT family N-acetyltransferase [Rubrivivax sp.]
MPPRVIAPWSPAPPRLATEPAAEEGPDPHLPALAELRAMAAELEGLECEAYRSLFEVATWLFGRSAFEVIELHGATVFLSSLLRRPGVFNRVLGWGLHRPPGVGALHALRACFEAAGCVPAYDLLPPLLGEDVSASMRALRIRKGAVAAVLHRALPADGEPLSPPRARPSAQVVQVVAVQGEETYAPAALCAEVFAMPVTVRGILEALREQPGWQHWLALVDGEPAGAALSFTRGGRCWFGWAATRPQFRGQGVKGALDDARIAAARAAGCRSISTDTATGTPAAPDPSLRSLTHRGFAPAYLRATYLPLAGGAGS